MHFPVSASQSLPGWPRPPCWRSTAVQRFSYIGTDCRLGERSARLLVRHQSHRQGFQHPAFPSGLSRSGTVCWSLWKPRTETVPAGSAGPPAAIWQSAHRGSDDAGQGLGNRRLLGNYKFHSCILLLLKMGKRIAHPGGDPNALCKEMSVSISLVSRYRLPRHCYGSSALPAILPLHGFLEY